MKNMNKKGQGAMEYLMTYGWAILVVLIVGIVLWQLGIFNLGGSSKTFTGFGAVKPLSWGVPASGDGVATMVNGEGATITPLNCTLSFTGTGVQCAESGTNSSCNVTTTGNIAAGAEFRLTFSNCTGGTAGDPYDSTLSVAYNKSIGTVIETHRSTGALKGPFE